MVCVNAGCRLPWLAAFWILVAWAASAVRAGGGPENVVVVVNRDSWASLAVANHYISLRGIPAANVVYLPDAGGTDTISVEEFRQRILLPVLKTVRERKVASQVQCIAYSSDFPYAVAVRGDWKDRKPPKVLTPTGSLNGLTYLHRLVQRGTPEYLGLSVNPYLRAPVAIPRSPPSPAGPKEDDSSGKAGQRGEAPLQFDVAPSTAFGGQWGPQGAADDTNGTDAVDRGDNDGRLPAFLLSTMLGVTSGRGNSVDEVLACLSRSAAADGTKPGGTIYFPVNSNIRSRTRDRLYPSAIALLQDLGVGAERLEGTIPEKKKDVLGAMIGAAAFDWGASGSRILPGAICEHLTSFGGMMREAAGQTPLSELIRHGAAGSSGTVVEPYAIQAKFPLPFLHVHYARGCSLAEAFYQSVSGPYQLLIVGDPLCQPWAEPPRLQPVGVPDAPARRIFKLATATTAESPAADRFELFIDGRRVAAQPRGRTLEIDTQTLADGRHELRVVAIAKGPIAAQSRRVFPIVVDNHGLAVSLTVDRAQSQLGGEVTVAVESPGAKSIEVRQNARVLGTVPGDQGRLQTPAATLGLGRVTLSAVAQFADGRRAVSPPVEVQVGPPPSLPPADPSANLAEGLLLRWRDGTQAVVESTRPPLWLAEQAEQSSQQSAAAFRLTGYFDWEVDEMCQLQAQGNVKCRIEIDGRQALELGDTDWHYLPLSLERGTHRLEVSGVVGDSPRLTLRMGSRGTQSLDSRRFRHAAP